MSNLATKVLSDGFCEYKMHSDWSISHYFSPFRRVVTIKNNNLYHNDDLCFNIVNSNNICILELYFQTKSIIKYKIFLIPDSICFKRLLGCSGLDLEATGLCDLLRTTPCGCTFRLNWLLNKKHI